MNIVHGGGGTVGDRLVRHPDVRVITLTGSRETGVEVLKAAADNLKHVHLELGGKNAVIVMDDADVDLAVEGILWSAFGTSGQRCTAASRVIAHEAVYDALQTKLVAAAERLRLGPGWEDDTDVGPVINKAAIEKIHSYTEIGRDEGARILTGGEVATEGDLAKGFFYRPTIFGDVDPQMRVAQEEIFGPATALIKVRDFDEAIRVSNGIKYGLSSSIFTRDVNKAFRAMRDLEAGITYVNAGTIGAEVHLPFGGTKDTGNGHREAGQAALDVFTEWKSIYVDYSGRLQKAQIDPPSDEARVQARVVRAAGGARGDPRRGVRRRRRTHRRLRALLVVHGRHRHVLRRRGNGAVDRPGGPRGARRRASRRDGRPGGSASARSSMHSSPRIRTKRSRTTSIRSSRLKAKLFTDGGARGNPGPAAYGYVIEADDGTVLAAHGEKIGVATNNVAEYRALIAGLAEGRRAGGAGGRGRLRLGAAREADDGRLPREERRPARAVARSRPPGPRDRQGHVYRGAPGAQRAGGPARERSPRFTVAWLYWPAPRGCSSVG